MLSPTQLNTSAHRPTRSARGPVPIRFGQSDKPVSINAYESSTEGFFAKLDKFSSAITGLHDFGPDKKDPYHNYDFRAQYEKLTERAKKHVRGFTEGLTPKDLEAMKDQKVLGVMEEASDMLFEADTLKALRKNVFTDKTVAQWTQKLLPAANTEARNRKPFEQLLREMDKDIPKDKAEQVEKQMDWDPKKAHEMLKLMAAKFVLMRSKDSNYDLWKDNKKLLMGEEEELRHEFPRLSLRQAQIKALALAYTHIPFLPLSFLQSQLEGIVSSRLHTPIKNSDMMDNVFAKQGRRQEFDYQNPEYKDKTARKKVLKGFEVLNEAAILKNARTWRPVEIQAF